MDTRIGFAFLLLACLLLSIPACVELTGQRITWHHDVAEDRLQILIHYDGIHEGTGSRVEGAEQIPLFIANQEILIFDWPFHFKWDEIGDDGDPTGEWRRLTKGIETAAIGYYREPSGQIGALQMVTIQGVSKFLAELNRLISTSLIAADEGWRELRGAPKTEARLLEAAREGHSWISLEGQAWRISWPVDAAEWAQTKRTILEGMFEQVISDHEAEPSDRIEIGAFLARLLSSSPVSYWEESGMVSLVLGSRDRQETMRLILHEEYETSLEEVVAKQVGMDLDHELARIILNGDHPDPTSPIGSLLSWGPPEEWVRPLLHLLSGDEGEDKAQLRLQAWSENWNRDHRWPRAPIGGEDLAVYRIAWSAWYREIKGDPPEKK